MGNDYSNQPVGGFTKLFSSLIHSTVWRTDMHVKVVWITMLAMADRNGRVMCSVPGLADASKVSLEQAIDALKQLSGPDEWSRTKANEGRRIQEIDGGWEILNYLKYRELRDADERRLQVRRAVARHRAGKSDHVSHGKPRKPKKAQAEAEAEAEKIKSKSLAPTDDVPPAWGRRAAGGSLARADTLVGDHRRCLPCAVAACERGVCVPGWMAQAWMQQLGRGLDAETEIRSMVTGELARVTGPIGDEPKAFWGAAWKARHGSRAAVSAPQSRGAQNVQAVRRAVEKRLARETGGES